ncbi:UNVERIFIED_ORG: hypothetical protein GGE53_005647 [Rhizobium etli]
MPTPAIKCVKCESFQGWRRVASTNTTMVALITALLSVATTSVPALFKLLSSDRSNLQASYGGDDTEAGLFLLVTNGGNGPGAIAKVEVIVNLGENKKIYEADVSPETVPTVLPKTSTRLRFMVDVGADKDIFQAFQGWEAAKCEIVASTLEFNRESQSYTFEMPCRSLRPLN